MPDARSAGAGAVREGAVADRGYADGLLGCGDLVDDDAIWVDVTGDGAAEIVALDMVLVTATGDDYRRALEQLVELLRKVVQGLDH